MSSQSGLSRVLRVIAGESVNLPIGWTPPSGIQKAVDVFVGYLLLDTWIGNGDRHHENWVAVFVVRKKSGDRFVYKGSRVQKWLMFSESDRSCSWTRSHPVCVKEIILIS